MRIAVRIGAIVALLVHTPGQPGVAQEAPSPFNPQLAAGGFLGYQNGPGGQFFVLARDFAEGFPLMTRLRLGLTSVEPGKPLDARRVFINDATNGTPKETGRTLDLGLDGLYPLGARAHLYGGVRYTRFRANFNFVGGNEDFDVTSQHWGLAMGLEGFFPMGARTDFLVSGGGEYFFSSRLSGHDTSYSPDGDHVNPRRDYTYDTADDAVEQPTWRPVFLVGLSYRLAR